LNRFGAIDINSDCEASDKSSVCPLHRVAHRCAPACHNLSKSVTMNHLRTPATISLSDFDLVDYIRTFLQPEVANQMAQGVA
jgi:hypothetical protein